tara:strand:- start:15888 stop:16463 length:576 start_codon:yes stop_codon:yes gene_type:complete
MPFGVTALPEVGFAITAPAPIHDSARFMRIHNRASKNAVRTTLLKHRLEVLPKHFQRGNRSRYDHMPRKTRTRTVKKQKFNSVTDLVKTGKTRDHMTSQFPVIRVGGSAQSVMKGTMHLTFPFPVNLEMDGGKDGKGVTQAQMAKEIGAWTEDESRGAADDMAQFYKEFLEQELADAPRLRKKLAAKVAAL